MSDIDVQFVDQSVRLTINRPPLTDPLSAATLDDLAELLEEFRPTTNLRVVVIGGPPDTFSMGPSSVGGEPNPGTPYDARFVALTGRVVKAIVRSELPVITAVAGAATGAGCAIAAAADVVVAAESATFSLPFHQLGQMPDGGLTATLAATLGRHRAMRMSLLGDPLSAVQAYDAGWVGVVARDDLFAGTVERVVRRVAAGSPAALAATKKAVNAATLGGLNAAIDREGRAHTALGQTGHAREAVAAQREGRRADFRGEHVAGPPLQVPRPSVPSAG